jgi:hypothetical protein
MSRRANDILLAGYVFAGGVARKRCDGWSYGDVGS